MFALLTLFQKLIEHIQEQKTGVEKQSRLEELEIHGNEVHNLKALQRRANIQVAANREKQYQKEREALFAGAKPAKQLKNP